MADDPMARGAPVEEATGKTLRILHLEDDPNDAELVQAALDAESLACQVRLVSTRQDFTAAVERGEFDLILSDFSLPGFDGLSALRIAREKAPHVPFIFVSGTIGEDAAIDSLKNGATDYVLKNRLSRLAAAARRTLREADERRKRLQSEEALHREQQFLRAMLDSMEEGIVACDAEGTLTLFNRAANDMHGFSSDPVPCDRWAERYALYQPDGKTLLRREEVPLFRALQGERVRNVELTILAQSKAPRTVLASGEPIIDAAGRKVGAVVALHDITERKMLEGQLRQAQKMEAVGRLAGGVAHDFNNLLNVIMGYGELLLERLADDGPMRDKVAQIRSAAERAAVLTRQLLAFSRKQVMLPRVLDLNALLGETDKMLRRLIGEDVELVTVRAPDLWRTKVDPGQIEQIIMNLVVNARDAMPRGGRLLLETANVVLDEEYAWHHHGARLGRYVMLAASDTGIGMDAEIQARIFEPFFTTKEAGKGTGLGLATVYGIVKQSGGYISVESEPGRGSTFRVYLPQVEEAAEPLRPRETQGSPRGTETILVVEDERLVREVVREGLERQGYTVLATGDVGQALEICRGHKGTISLLITDVILPRMSGPEVAKQVSALLPGVGVLFMSGYTNESIVQRALIERGAAFLQKPFTMTALACKVREVLDAAKAAA